MKAMRSILAFSVLTLFCAMAMGESKATLVSDTEDMSARNATTRIFNRTYSVPVLDAQFQPTSDTRTETRTLIEKADGLCYDASLNVADGPTSAPCWELTDTRFIEDCKGGWSIVTGPAKIRIASTASVSNLVSYTIPFRIPNPDKDDESHPYLKRSLSLKLNGGALYYYDTITARKIVLSAPSPVAGRADGNRVIFEGAYTCGDLEFVYDKGAFHQNVIIRNVGALPTPSSLGLDPALTELRVVTDIENATTENSGVVVHAAETGLRMTGPSGKVLCSFMQSFAFPASSAQDRRIMTKAVAPISGETKKYSHAEGVPYSYVLEKSFGDDLVLDYGLGTVTEDISQAWQAGYTYWITGDYTVGEGKTLVIEGGVVVKVRDDASLMGDGGNVLIKGTPFNYALFTKESDNTVGETVSPANSNDVDNFLCFYFKPDTSLQVQFAKFANADDRAIWINSDSIYEGGFVEVRDSIFRDCNYGVGVGGDFYMDDSRINIFNCLFVNSHVSLNTYNNKILDASILNCTFDSGIQNNCGIVLSGKFKATFQNIFYANMPFAVSGNATFESGSCINYDATCTVTARLSSTIATALTNAGGTSTPTNTGSSFVTCSNGDYYFGEPEGAEPNTGTSENLSEDYENRLFSTTVIRPAVVDDELDLLDRTDWDDYWADAGDPDIGFHYDIVHGEVSGYQYLSESIDLEPGIAISIDEDSQIILNGEDKNFNSCGLPHKRIRYISMNATSDKISDPYRISQMSNGGVAVGNGASLTCDFSEFAFLSLGLFADSYTTCDIKNSIFNYNERALWLLGRGQTTRIQNCLFSNSAITAVDFMGYDMSNLNIIGCTFDRNEHSIAYQNGPWGNHVCNAVIEDNIFTNNNEVVGNSDPELTVHAIVRNNLFWNNEQDISSISTDMTNLKNVNPLFAHRAAASEGDVLQNWASDKDAPWDGYYLAQREGDASRRPFILREGQLLDQYNGIDFCGGDVGDWSLRVRAGFGEVSERGSVCQSNMTCTYYAGAQTESGPLCLIFDAGASAMVGGSLTLRFADGSELAVNMPYYLSVGDDSTLCLWVAEDGSTWWAHSDCEIHNNSMGRCDMDAWYAMRWHKPSEQSGKEAVAEYAGAISPAVDAGSKDWLNGGTTKTEVGINDETIPDNPAPANFGDPDNLDEYGEPTFVDWNDGSRLLDIGYHYGGDSQTKDSATIYTTLRHPKERITNFTYNNDTISPDVSSADEMVLVSGKYETNTMKDLTIAIYRGTPLNNGNVPVCYRAFRGSSEEMGIITNFSMGDYYPDLTITGTSGPADDAQSGAVYVAINKWEFTPGLEIGRSINSWIIEIYRYDPLYQDKWRHIGKLEPYVLPPFMNQDRHTLSQPVGLAAQGDNLWVFWMVEEPSHIVKMYGSYMANAATNNTLETLIYDYGYPLITIDFQDLGNECISLKSDWDDYLIDQYHPLGLPRIVFGDSSTMEFYSQPRIWAKRVLLLNGYPYQLDPDNTNQPIGYNNIIPTFCLNRPYEQFQISHNTNRAFCRFVYPYETQIEKRNLNIKQDSNDEWVTPSNYNISNASQPSVTYRAFGTDRLFYINNQKLYEERMGIFEQSEGNAGYPQVITERPKAENIFLMHKGVSSDVIDIYHIVP